MEKYMSMNKQTRTCKTFQISPNLMYKFHSVTRYLFPEKSLENLSCKIIEKKIVPREKDLKRMKGYLGKVGTDSFSLCSYKR